MVTPEQDSEPSHRTTQTNIRQNLSNALSPKRTAPQWRVLLLLGCVMSALFLLLQFRFPLLVLYSCARTNLDKITRIEATPPGLILERYDCPTQNIDKLIQPHLPTGLMLMLGLCALFAAYLIGAIHFAAHRLPIYQPAPQSRLTSWLLIGFPVLFCLQLLWVYPFSSVDLYDYLFRGRMLTHYGANNFVQTPLNYSSDPFFRFVAWQRSVTAYGPLWEGLSWIASSVAGERRLLETESFFGPNGMGPLYLLDDPERNVYALLRLMLAFKGLGALGYLLCGAAIWGALNRSAPEQRLFGLFLWLWNPLVIWESVGAGHNDTWMALCMVLAAWAFSERRSRAHPNALRMERSSSNFGGAVLGCLALTIGGLIKYLSLILGPILLGAALRRMPTWRARIGLIVVAGNLCIGLTVLAYAPFWQGWQTFNNFTNRITLFNASWLTVLRSAMVVGGVAAQPAMSFATVFGMLLLLVGVLWAAWRAWMHPRAVAEHMLWLLLWFLFLCNPWFQPWYLLWPLALVAIQPWRTNLVVGLGMLSFTAMLGCYVAWTFLRPILGWSIDSVSWSLLLCLIIYTVPLVMLIRSPSLQPQSITI